MNTRLTPVFIGVAPLDPRFTGGRLPNDWAITVRRTKSEWLTFLAPGTLAPITSKI